MADEHDLQDVLDEVQWEKPRATLNGNMPAKRSGRWRFMVLGLSLLGAIAYLLFNGTGIGARYYVTVEELLNDEEMLDKNVRVSGAVVADPVFDPATNELHFVVANIPNDNDAIRDQGGLALVLFNAINDPDNTRLRVIAHDKEIPDLLKKEAQAIMSGRLKMVDGEPVFFADTITLKCPTKYEEDSPDLVANNTGIGGWYMTVEELLTGDDNVGKNVPISGAVVGDPVFDRDTNELHFVVANIPNDDALIVDQGGLALVLSNAVNDPDNIHLRIIAQDLEIPDPLKHGAQAVISGHLEMVDGEPVFYADTLRCPTIDEEEHVPDQVAN